MLTSFNSFVKGAEKNATGTMYGGNGWDTTNTLGTAAGTGITGSQTAGLWVAVLVRVNDVSCSNSQNIASMYAIGGQGWRLYADAGATPNLYFSVGNGTSFTNSTAHVITSDSLGRMQLYVGVHSGTVGKNTLWVNGAPLAAANTMAYIPASGTTRMTIGQRPGAATSQATNMTILGIAGGTGVPTNAEIIQLYSSSQITGDIVEIPGKTNNLYSVKKDTIASGTYSSFPNGLIDRVSSVNMSFYGGASTGVDLHKIENASWTWNIGR